MKIDIAMTAALRPQIVRRTLSSLQDNLTFMNESKLVVDIAPVGDTRRSQADILEVVRQYFPDRYNARMQRESLQADALKWTWQHVTTEFFWQWEDDWELTCPISETEVKLMVDFMNNNPNLGLILLDRCEKPVYLKAGYMDQFRYIHSGMWNREEAKSLGGPPALIRKEYADQVCSIVDGAVCLDILSSEPEAQSVLDKWDIYLYGKNPDGLVRDIGKPWVAEMGLKRIKRSDKGVQWVKNTQ